MAAHTAAVVGAGSQGRVHARGYQTIADVTVTGLADINIETAAETAADLSIPRWYADYRELLDAERPDLLSICTPPVEHLAVVRQAIDAGVRAIHCEKPIATTYGDALEMHDLAAKAGVQLTFNLQRRYEAVHAFAREQIAAGTIGEIISIEGYCPNLPDWGTHVCDLILFYLGDVAPSWVFGQVDVSVNRYVYGAFAETSSLTHVQWPNGVNATVLTGREPQTPTRNLQVNTGLIVHGAQGRIEATGARCIVRRFDEPELIHECPFNRDQSTWERGVDPSIVAGTAAAIQDVVASLESGREPRLASRHGLAGAEIIFATYESSRTRSRVELPLRITDNPLLTGLAEGFWQPRGEQRSTY